LLGMGLTWRAKPALAALITSVLLTLALSAGHDAMAGETTPARYLVAGLPLLMVFVADAALHWQRSRVFTAALVVLTLVSIDSGVTYNLHFEKGVSQLVADGFAGFRPNLLFPAVTRDGWKTLPWAVTIVGAWASVFAGLLVAGVWSSWRAARHAPSWPAHPLTWSIRPSARFIAGGFAILAAAGTVVSAARGEFVRSDFMPTPAEVRDRALESFREQGRCTACAATGFGEANPVDVLGFATTALSLDLAPTPGPGLSYRLRAVAVRGETERGWGSLSVDFGDGVVERDSRVFGERDLDHTYPAPAMYVVKTSFDSGGGVRFDDERLLNVRGRPESRTAPPALDNISRLPPAARDSRRTATITDVFVGGGGVDVRHDAGGRWSGEDVWLVTHTAAGWLAAPVNGPVNPPASGAMVGVLVVARGMASAERTGLAMFHWPPAEVTSRRGPVRVALVFRGPS